MAKPIRHRIVGKMVAKRLGMTRRQEQPRVSSMLQYGSVASQIDNNKTSLDSPANLRTNPFTRSEQQGAVAEPQISPRTPPACVFHYSPTPGGSLRFAHRGLNSFTPPACKPAARKGCSDISPGLSEAIPGVIAPPLDSRTLKACEEIPVEQQAPAEEGSRLQPLSTNQR